MGAMAEGDTDEFKRVLLEGNPFFLGLTFCVSMLHSVSPWHLQLSMRCMFAGSSVNHTALAAFQACCRHLI
jgi:Cleft lip and palate transmembrane protein 1 (CLPTM1)